MDAQQYTPVSVICEQGASDKWIYALQLRIIDQECLLHQNANIIEFALYNHVVCHEARQY